MFLKVGILGTFKMFKNSFHINYSIISSCRKRILGTAMLLIDQIKKEKSDTGRTVVEIGGRA